MKNTIHLLLLVALTQTGFAQLRPENINGIISFAERRDTTGSKIHSTGNENILIRSDRDFVYLGIHSTTLASANVILNRGDEFVIIHISGCTGRGTYQRVAGDSLKVVEGIYDVDKRPEKWDVIGRYASAVALKKEKTLPQQQAEMLTCFERWGYMASTLDMGSYRDVEVLLSKRAFRDYGLLVQNTVTEHEQGKMVNKRSFHPATGITADAATAQEFLACTPGDFVTINLKTEEWLTVTDF